MRSLAVASLAAVLTCCMAAVAPVLRYEVQPDVGFTYHSCATNFNSTVVINSMTVTPDPILMPGDYHVSFNVTVKEEIHDQLKAELDVWAKFGPEWFHTACMGGFGSCTYDNVCDMLKDQGPCPEEFLKFGLPCKCPFKQGNYYLPVSAFRLNNVVPAADYRVKVHLSVKGQPVGCYAFSVSIVGHL